jgi:hypothetical protein
MKIPSCYSLFKTLNRTAQGELSSKNLSYFAFLSLACTSMFAAPQLCPNYKKLHSHKWKILALASLYTLMNRKEVKRFLPLNFNLLEIVTSPFSTLRVMYSDLDASLASMSLFLLPIISIPFYFIANKAVIINKPRTISDMVRDYNALGELVQRDKNELLAVGFLFSSLSFAVLSVISEKSGDRRPGDIFFSIADHMWADGVLSGSPLLLNLSYIQIQGRTLSFLLKKVEEVFERFVLELELTNWEESTTGSQVKRNAVVGEISRAINESGSLLDLFGNELTETPPMIWKMKNLRQLSLSCNNITHISPDVAQLENLRTLDLSHNLELLELPDELATLPNLETIKFECTKINPGRVDDILERARLKKQAAHLIGLPKILVRWRGYTRSFDKRLIAFINGLDNRKKSIIADWLKRVEKTPEFLKDEKPVKDVVKVVSNILGTVSDDPDFAKVFFPYIEFNNTDCEDHAGMVLNEVYTFWILAVMKKKNYPLEKRVNVLLRAVKTYTLRYYLSEWIQKNEPENSHSAEIFLFYENLLRSKLDLLSAVGIMKYKNDGDRLDVLSKDKVFFDIKNSYLSNLLAITDFEKLLEDDENFSNLWSRVAEKYQEKAVELSSKNLSSEESRVKNEKLLKEVKVAKNILAVLWLARNDFITEAESKVWAGSQSENFSVLMFVSSVLKL